MMMMNEKKNQRAGGQGIGSVVTPKLAWCSKQSVGQERTTSGGICSGSPGPHQQDASACVRTQRALCGLVCKNLILLRQNLFPFKL